MSSSTPRSGRAPGADAAAHGAAGAEAGDKRGALEIALQAFAENPLGEWAQRTSRRLARSAAAGPSWSRRTKRRCRGARESDAKAVLPLLGTLAGAYESELGKPEAAIERNQAILKIAPSDPEAVGALERLYIATGRFADLLAIYDKKLELAKSKTEELEIRFKLAGLYEEEIKQPEKAIELIRRSSRRTRAVAGADGARSHLHRLGRWKELAAT